ncbi:MAG TPA: DUF4145 domain-containing protein, partial [Steroidobacteraceae bacterium]
KHAIPPLPVDRQGKGEIQYRIDRLSESGVRITKSELSAMHDIRIDGNDGAHPQGKKHRFTRTNAEAALRNAGRIRDWLNEQYLRPARAPQKVPRSAKSNPDPPPRIPLTTKTETKGNRHWKVAAGVVLLLILWAFVSRNSASRNASQYVGSDKQIEDTRRAEREHAAQQQQVQADQARRRQKQVRQRHGLSEGGPR